MIVKPATIDLLSQLIDLSPRFLANGIRTLAPLDLNAWVADLWRLMNAADRRLFVAVETGRVVGVHAVIITPVAFAPSVTVVRTLTLWVDPSQRGTGVGTQLQEAAEQWSKAIGARFMLAGVPSDYSAHGDSASADLAEAFYEGRGYERLEVQFLKEVG